MKRIILKNGKRIRAYCECDKGHKWNCDIGGMSPNNLQGQCTGTGTFCNECDLYMWTYSK